jgi:hypothetical protein
MARKYYPRPDTPIGSSGVVEYSQLFPIGQSVVVVKIGTPEWDTWLASVDAFAYQVGDIFFSLKRYPRRRGRGYWRAYKTVHGVTQQFYIGADDKVTVPALEDIAAELYVLINRILED